EAAGVAHCRGEIGEGRGRLEDHDQARPARLEAAEHLDQRVDAPGTDADPDDRETRPLGPRHRRVGRVCFLVHTYYHPGSACDAGNQAVPDVSEMPPGAGGRKLASMLWEPLGTVPARELVPARLVLHWAAQIVASAAALLPPRADDSHTALTW